MFDLLFAQAAPEHWLDALVVRAAGLFPPGSFFAFPFNLQALLALVLVSLSCGAVGALVVGGRMAFFSDALARCAFASVSVGFVFFTLLVAPYLLAQHRSPETEFWSWVTPIMVVLGMVAGYGIAYVRERTGLASDTVIGVFFALAIGLAATLSKIMQ